MTFCDDCRDCFGSTDLYFILQINTIEKENLTNAKSKFFIFDFNFNVYIVKKAYYKQSMLWHPDRFEDEEKKVRAMKRFQVASKAYIFLNDPEKRKNYDSAGEFSLLILYLELLRSLIIWKFNFRYNR